MFFSQKIAECALSSAQTSFFSRYLKNKIIEVEVNTFPVAAGCSESKDYLVN